MKSKHTNGPWESVDGTTTGKTVIAPNEPKVRRNVAMVGGQNRDGNAKLIAAAPDMLAALELLVKYAQWQISEGESHHPTLPSAVGVAVDAIAKARGEI